MKTLAPVIVALVPVGFWMSAAAVAAPDLAAGKSVAVRTCAACHGVDGIGRAANNPSPLVVPDLAGQKETYLVAQLHAFKDGSRPNPVMSSLANTLSDAEMRNVAAYYASLESCRRSR